MLISTKGLLRGLLCPAAFTFTVILHARNSARLPALLPALWPVSADISQRARRPVPTSLYAAFRLGRLIERMQSPSSNLSDHGFVSEARSLLDGELANTEELQDLEVYLESLEKRATIVSRIRGFLSFVNFIWLVSIIGLCLTLWPTLQILGGRFLHVASQWFLQNELPILIRFHRLGVFEALSYVICTWVVSQAARYLSTMGPGAPGSYVVLTAFALAMVAFRYTMHLHFDDHLIVANASDEMNKAVGRTVALLWSGFQFAVLAPLAMVHKSELLGFGGIWSLLTALGFIAGTVPWGYFVGFTAEDALDRTAIACALLVTCFVLAKLFDKHTVVPLKPFHLGVMVLGNLGYFLALLIRSSKYYHGGWKRFVIAQVHMVVSLAVTLGVGRVFGIEAMNSTATTFGALYLVEKISELPWEDWAIVGWFGVFGLLYVAAAFLRTHPRYLKSLIDVRGLLE